MKSTIKTVLVLFAITLFLSCTGYGEKLVFNGTEVYYLDGIEKGEAENLGNFLVRSEFADGRTKSVQLTKNGNYVFRMVTNKDAQEKKQYEILFKVLASQISDSVFSGKPVDFDICTNTFESVKYLPAKVSK